jgi:hypothetical protein
MIESRVYACSDDEFLPPDSAHTKIVSYMLGRSHSKGTLVHDIDRLDLRKALTEIAEELGCPPKK